MLYQLRYVLAVVWVAQLAWLSAPAVEAAEDLGMSPASYRTDSLRHNGDCGNSWAADNCGLATSSWTDDERPNETRHIKARDIAKGILRNFAGDELDLLRLKQRANFKPYARHLGVSRMDLGFSVTSNGAQMRLHANDNDNLALSLRSAGDEEQLESETVLGINVGVAW